jgi:hypothetical protein
MRAISGGVPFAPRRLGQNQYDLTATSGKYRSQLFHLVYPEINSGEVLDWIQTRCEGVSSREDAVTLLTRMVDAGLMKTHPKKGSRVQFAETTHQFVYLKVFAAQYVHRSHDGVWVSVIHMPVEFVYV